MANQADFDNLFWQSNKKALVLARAGTDKANQLSSFVEQLTTNQHAPYLAGTCTNFI